MPCGRSIGPTRASSSGSRSTRSASAERPRSSSRRSSPAPGATPSATTRPAPACAPGSTRSPATRSSTCAGAPPCGPALALHEPSAGPEPLGESIEQAMLGWQVATALERLSPDHRQMIRLAHLQGLTMREIAEHTRPAGGHRQEPHLVRAARAAARARGDGGPMSALRTCDDLRPLLGGYVLEALEPDETEAVREHLPGCPACSAEHASLAGLPALLDLAAPLDAPDEPLSPAFEEALLDRFARDREAARRARARAAAPPTAAADRLDAPARRRRQRAARRRAHVRHDDGARRRSAGAAGGLAQLRRAAEARRVRARRPRGRPRRALPRPRRHRRAPVGPRPPQRLASTSTRCCARRAAGARARARSAPTPTAASRRSSRPPRASGNTTASASSTGTSADTPRTS